MGCVMAILDASCHACKHIVEPMVDGFTLTKDGQVDPKELAKWVRQASLMGLTPEDAAKVAAYKYVPLIPFLTIIQY